jgi:hypothetical protein
MSICTVPAFLAAAMLVAISFPANAQQKPQPPQSLRLYVLDCGIITPPDVDNYGLKPNEVADTRMVTPCFLIVHRGVGALGGGGLGAAGIVPGGFRQAFEMDRHPRVLPRRGGQGRQFFRLRRRCRAGPAASRTEAVGVMWCGPAGTASGRDTASPGLEGIPPCRTHRSAA